MLLVVLDECVCRMLFDRCRNKWYIFLTISALQVGYACLYENWMSRNVDDRVRYVVTKKLFHLSYPAIKVSRIVHSEVLIRFFLNF